MTEQTEKSPLKRELEDVRCKFSSPAGLIATCLGCAIGTGNVWRFPRMVALNSGKKGALCFLLPWILFLFIWSIPMLIIEYGIGRHTGQGVVTSTQRLMGDKAVWCGMWIVLVNFMISCWYQVLMGWCIFYAYRVTFLPLPRTVHESTELFDHYIDNSYWPILTQALGIVAAGILMTKGIRLIERANLIMVPILLTLVVIIFIWSLTRQGALRGIQFFFTPDWATLASPRLWVDAASQNAFDCSAGWGQFITLGAAMQTTDPVIKYALLIPIGNNVISLICGMMTFSTAFSSMPNESNITADYIDDMLQTSGPAGTGLTFIWLPVLFASADVTGRVFASLFFVCLVLAALSSLITTLENVTKVFDNYGVHRLYSVLTVTLASFIIGLGSAINLNFLTNQDFTWAVALIISGLFLLGMVIKYGTAKFRNYVINDYGPHDWHVPRMWEWLVKYVAPIEGIALLLWWVVDTIIRSNNDIHPWYAFGPQTLLPVLIQWIGGLVILVIINVILVYLQPGWFMDHSFSTQNEPLLDASVDDLTGDVDSSVIETNNGQLIKAVAEDIITNTVSESNGKVATEDH